MKYVPPHLRAQTEAKEKQEAAAAAAAAAAEKAEQEKEKENIESKKDDKDIDSDSSTEGDDFEIVLNSVVISQISKNKDLRGELLGYYIKSNEENKKKKKKKKKGKGNDEEGEGINNKDQDDANEDAEEDDENEDDEDDDEDDEDNDDRKKKKRKDSIKDLKKNKKNDSKKLNVVEINQSFCVCNIEDICIDKISKISNKYQIPKQRYNELLNNLVLYFNKNKMEEDGEKYITDVNNYYDDYVNIMAELNFETTSFGFYINICDIKKKEVLATLLLSSLINKNSFVLCFAEKYGKLIFSAYKIDVDVVFEIKNQIKNTTFNQFSDILNVELKKKGLNSKNILQKIPIRIKNSIINSLFLKVLKSKNKNYLSSLDYLNTSEVDSLEGYIQDTCKSLEMLKTEQEKIIKYKKDVFKQLQSQKIYQEKKKLEKEKNKIEHDNQDTNEEDANIQNIFKNIPQPSLLFPYVLTMSNNLLNDNINNLCSHAIAKSYLYYKNAKP
ncbi:conserved Plasmodium protein, unknown function [Plasmodium ovale]|uniref:eIF3h C-terminal domain-containing protein n=2 Tax=Plasmodium ovale TaxID=36330 RepID=A0A1A8W3Y6_PLAOA|nr:conserved Plasmodium protein, unknown function [Plasmodium ovale curtisi]SBS97631.1 conserved Plasmodium protein, unknown function [Plasmodium ovale curtisi]SCP06219.1 conserved Plasmodium protein, unknown function [Plasmodium ovale]